MESNFNGALESISIIKKSINNGKANLKIMYKLFLISSILWAAEYIVSQIAKELWLKGGLIEKYSNYSMVNFILTFIAQLIFFIYYIKLYKDEKNNSNKYYVNFLNLFGVTKFIIPFVQYIFRTIYMFKLTGNENVTSGNLEEIIRPMYNSLNIMSATFGILFMYISLNLLGEIVNKKFYKIFSLIILIAYIGKCIFFGDSHYMEYFGSGIVDSFTRLYIFKYIGDLGLLFNLIMPLTLKIEERKAYGNK